MVWNDKHHMSFLRHISFVCLSLMAVSTVMANEPVAPGPLTLAQVDRIQDLWIDNVQKKIAEISAKPTLGELKGLFDNINFAKRAEKSPFSPGFQYQNVEVLPASAKTTRPKSSAERQALQEIDDAFSRSLQYITEAKKAVESGQSRGAVSRLASVSKELLKIGAILDEQRRRRPPLAGTGKGQLAGAGMVQQVPAPNGAKAPAAAAEADESAPLTLEEVDRAQDLYLDRIQNLIVKISEKPSKAGFSELWNHIRHAKNSDKSPFAPDFQYYHVAASSMPVKAAPPKSSAERQAQQDIDNAFARSLKFVLEAQREHDSGNKHTFVSRLTSASKEVAKVGAELDALRKRRSTQGVAVNLQQSSAGATKSVQATASALK